MRPNHSVCTCKTFAMENATNTIRMHLRNFAIGNATKPFRAYMQNIRKGKCDQLFPYTPAKIRNGKCEQLNACIHAKIRNSKCDQLIPRHIEDLIKLYRFRIYAVGTWYSTLSASKIPENIQ